MAVSRFGVLTLFSWGRKCGVDCLWVFSKCFFFSHSLSVLVQGDVLSFACGPQRAGVFMCIRWFILLKSRTLFTED